MSREYITTIILEYYNKFPEPYKSQAIYNYNNFPISLSIPYNITSALRKFNWSQTSEGAIYWYNFCNSLIKK